MNDNEWEAFRGDYRRASAQFVLGDAEALLALCATEEPMHICGAFGGYECGVETVRQRIGWAAKQLSGGTFDEEVLIERVGAEDAMTFAVETIEARVAGAPVPVRQVLRVTQVYRRQSDGWRLAHRHADFVRPTSTDVPLVEPPAARPSEV